MALDRRIVELYDEYTHKPLDRRSFMNRLITIAGSAAAAEAALSLLEPNYAQAQQVAADDARIESRRIDETVGGVRLKGYLVTPKTQGRRGGVLVIHENRGLNPHIEDVTRRAALAGFSALGVDFLTPLGGTPADADAARALFPQLKPEDVVAQARAALAFLKARPDTTGKVGAVGFCWGGGAVNDLAVSAPELNAGVVFYGRSPDLAKVPQIKARLLIQQAARDTRLVEGLPAYEAALKAAAVNYQAIVYPDVDHAFHNDTSAERYNAAAAKLAWERTVAFLAAETGAA
ncbi:Carboxymethylenebutenolidase [Bosea sp. 62]|uniref:dienelactone hydrolase family protein n=1 Tax=unclassified Bosea (in: a-proteobacteria) TaxID=2653178 RepID=UPI0012571FBB|nr:MULTISPECIES: dienelactone hydrolase family protein [unclassified Bosea (in: a-proteobacteria)]CAD5252518.1 Carboxymethylenebutenolidase [Bosea sp. 7B]CAD5278879.1 Carboxymethylenebutenolidase [Bosea sp. 21B]CAD5279999.1 Carboxymethylenebutenolidase [Bosea sp. 46]VVT59602.1 Carboxymethylenebutenolidase [Bosea sp. EC-HK365B]VXB35592.1 Carboxymethylenebutenolidase [Bosea sp. 62]